MKIFSVFYTLLFLLLAECRASKKLDGTLDEILLLSGILSRNKSQVAVRVSHDGLKASRFHLYSGIKTEADQTYYMQFVMPMLEATYDYTIIFRFEF